MAHVLALGAVDAPGVCLSYNLGCGGSGYSVREVIDMASRVTDRRIPVAFAPRRPGDPAVLVASSGRIRRDLGWKPRYQQLDTIMRSAWQWMSRNGRAHHI